MSTHSTHRAGLIAAVALVGLTLPSLASAQTPPPPPPPPAAAPDPHTFYPGTYQWIGGARERTELDHAIDRAVDGMFFIAAAVARGRLHDKNPLPARIIIALPPGQVSVSFDGRTPYVSPENNGRVNARDLTGAPVRVSTHWENGHIVQVIGTDEGYRRSDFIVSADGHAMTMQVELVSPSLPHHLRYSLTFRR